MKVELIEQLGVTPTPGGIDKLLQSQTEEISYLIPQNMDEPFNPDEVYIERSYIGGPSGANIYNPLSNEGGYNPYVFQHEQVQKILDESAADRQRAERLGKFAELELQARKRREAKRISDLTYEDIEEWSKEFPEAVKRTPESVETMIRWGLLKKRLKSLEERTISDEAQNYYNGGIVNLAEGGDAQKGHYIGETDPDLDALYEELDTIGRGTREERKKRRELQRQIRSIRKKRPPWQLGRGIRNLFSGAFDALGQGLLRQHISDPQLDQFADETQANIAAEAAGEETPFPTPA